jgi:hypothetical protein
LAAFQLLSVCAIDRAGEKNKNVTDDDDWTSLIVAPIHLNDNAAIRSARILARAHKFEDWRGMDCIYGTDEATIINLRTAQRRER